MQPCDSHGAKFRAGNPGSACGLATCAKQAAGASRPGSGRLSSFNLAHVLGASRWNWPCSIFPCLGGLGALGFTPRLYQQGRCAGTANHALVLSTMALRAGVLRRAVSLAAPLVGYAAVASASTAMLLHRTACSRRAVSTNHALSGSNIRQRRCAWRSPRRLSMLPPNPSVNRSANGWPPCPRAARCLSCASRARRPPVVARLPLR
jgi:hypothetical protein